VFVLSGPMPTTATTTATSTTTTESTDVATPTTADITTADRTETEAGTAAESGETVDQSTELQVSMFICRIGHRIQA
jgi:hypothetical protein